MSSYEKTPLAPHPNAIRYGEQGPSRRTQSLCRALMFITISLIASYFVLSQSEYGFRPLDPSSGRTVASQCPQPNPLRPSKHTDALSRLEEYLDSGNFRNASIDRLSGAVRIPSESYDDLGPVGEDERWEVMYDLAAYLKQTFPLVHSKIQLEKINTHGLLYTWKGSDDSLKPTILMAHQDVVPVAQSTVSQWTYPPYSGTYDGRYIWGRGASDCKNTLIGILEAVELLIDAQFEPKRTLVLSFGFDEESKGFEGAGTLATTLLDRYGSEGAAVIVDEGSGAVDLWGQQFAAPGVAEKGHVDVEVIIRAPGGHSSVPPPHTGIGIMSEFITAVENDRYKSHLATENPFLEVLQCGAKYAPDFPSEWKKLLPSGKHSDSRKKEKLAHKVAESSDALKYLFTTSIAVDIINGGVKANALPERTTALINHRVNIGEQVADVQDRLTKLASQVAKKYNFTLHAFNDDKETPSSITLRARGVLEPAPIAPTDLSSLTPYAVVSGTTRALYGEQLVMAPALSTGNTDTRFYWDLTKHIYRYQPGFDPDNKDSELGNIHTVNERVSVANHLNVVKWYTLFVRNIDEADF